MIADKMHEDAVHFIEELKKYPDQMNAQITLLAGLWMTNIATLRQLEEMNQRFHDDEIPKTATQLRIVSALDDICNMLNHPKGDPT